MRRLKAHVRNGQVVLDEPATLPEGTALEITILEGSNDTEASDVGDPVTASWNAMLAKLTSAEVEADLKVVRAAARATMKRSPS